MPSNALCGPTEPYNLAMSLRNSIKFAIPIAVTIIGWFLAPIIKAKLDGTQLNGLPGILHYWSHKVETPLMGSCPLRSHLDDVGGYLDYAGTAEEQ
jgi:hypothetical protein